MTTAAIAQVLGGAKLLRQQVKSESELQKLTRAGLPVDALSTMAQSLSLDRKTVAQLLGISSRTLSRRTAQQDRLSAEESDRTVRLARIIAQATDTLGSLAKASRWLQTPNRALEGQVPLHMLDTDTGVRAVETILGRIEWGLYS